MKIHPWISDIAASSLSDRRELDQTVCKKLSSAFEAYAGAEPGLCNIRDIISSQGYDVKTCKDHLRITISGTVSCVCLLTCNMTGCERQIVLGGNTIATIDGEEHYPLFAAGMFTCLDPSEKNRFRQKRIDYSWPDTSIPGR